MAEIREKPCGARASSSIPGIIGVGALGLAAQAVMTHEARSLGTVVPAGNEIGERGGVSPPIFAANAPGG